MSHGLVIRNAAGQIVLDTTKQTWNYLGFFVAPAGTATTRTFPDGAGMTLVAQQYLLDDLPDNQEIVVHSLAVGGTSVTASGGSRASIVTVLGR